MIIPILLVSAIIISTIVAISIKRTKGNNEHVACESEIEPLDQYAQECGYVNHEEMLEQTVMEEEK